MEIKTVGVVGCGLMGHGIAQIAAQGGHKVIVAEAEQGALDKGLGRIEKSLTKLAQELHAEVGGGWSTGGGGATASCERAFSVSALSHAQQTG